MYLPIGGGAEGRGGSVSGKMDNVGLSARRATPWGGPKARGKPRQWTLAALHLVRGTSEPSEPSEPFSTSNC